MALMMAAGASASNAGTYEQFRECDKLRPAVSRINPTTLSDQQNCYIDLWVADGQTNGRAGFFLWFQNGDARTSVLISEIQKSKNKDAAKELVATKIIESIVEVEVEKIVEVPGPTVTITETIEVPGPTVTEYITVEVPGPTVIETIEVEVPGPTVIETVEVEVPGPTVIEYVTIEVPGPAVTITETIEVPGPTVIEYVNVEVPGPTVIEYVNVEVPGPTITITETVEVPGPTVTVTETVEVPVEVIREVIVDRIVEVTTGRDQLIAELGTTTGDVAAAVAEIQHMTAEITRLNGEVTTLNTAITAYTDEIEDIKDALDRFGPVETAAGRLQRINDIVADLRAANADLFFQAEAIADAVVKAGNINGYSDADLFVFQSRGDNYVEIEDRDDVVNAASEDVDNVTVQGQARYNSFTSQYETTNISINGISLSFVSTESWSDVIEQAVEHAYDEGYRNGFDDGYDTGYADGYRDGFTDGVNEVR